jgi:hypothetical protein
MRRWPVDGRQAECVNLAKVKAIEDAQRPPGSTLSTDMKTDMKEVGTPAKKPLSNSGQAFESDTDYHLGRHGSRVSVIEPP